MPTRVASSSRSATTVKTVVPGDTSSVNAGLSDRTCEYCRAGEQPLCPRFGLLGEHFPGTLAEMSVVPATNVRAIPPTIAPDAGGGVHARDADGVANGRDARASAAPANRC